MFAVIFEVWLADGRKEDYLSIAAALKPQLERIEGFVSVERFASLTDPDRILSLSIWRDEEAIGQWRALEAHRSAQTRGRGGIFRDYRIRVAAVIRDYGMNEREQVPSDSRRVHG